jgi:hypothetical protein
MTVCRLLVNVDRLCPCARLNFSLLTQIPVDCIDQQSAIENMTETAILAVLTLAPWGAQQQIARFIMFVVGDKASTALKPIIPSSDR